VHGGRRLRPELAVGAVQWQHVGPPAEQRLLHLGDRRIRAIPRGGDAFRSSRCDVLEQRVAGEQG
jgi:hypothetical protein